MSKTLEKTNWEYRADSGKLGEWQLTPEGYLVAHAKIARIGIQEYPNPDGTVRREFRPPEEVASRDSLKTLCDLPISIEHPPAMLDSSNARQFAVGWNGSVSYDGGFVSTKVKLIDKHAVKNALDGGRIELSVGYMTKLDWTPGTWEGQRYDAIQRNIKGNHIALTVRARGGADLRLYPGLPTPEIHKDSEILEKCWQFAEPTWNDSDVRLDNLHIKVGGESMKMHDEDDLRGKSKEDLISLVMEMQSMWAEKEEELSETKDSAVYWQGRATAYEDSLSVESDLSRSDSDSTVHRRVQEKQIQITELESRLDSAERENTALRRQFDEARAKAQRLDTDLTAVRESQAKAVTTQRETWIKTWNEALPFLPKVAINEPDYTMDSVGIMRLALQNSRPALNLDSLVQSASNPDDVIRTAFSVMVAEGVSKPTAERGFMAQFIDQAKADSTNYHFDSVEKIRQETFARDSEAWKVKN